MDHIDSLPGDAALAAQTERMESDFRAIHHAMRKPLDAEFAQINLTMPQKALMQVVVMNQGMSLKDLSRQLSLAHSTVSGIVDRLEKHGLIERRSDPVDGRITRIHPSAEVAAFVTDQVPALLRRPLHAALQRATAAERKLIERAVRRLRELLEVT
jgi:DNA-binding MarR family transcriptional regulator